MYSESPIFDLYSSKIDLQFRTVLHTPSMSFGSWHCAPGATATIGPVWFGFELGFRGGVRVVVVVVVCWLPEDCVVPPCG